MDRVDGYLMLLCSQRALVAGSCVAGEWGRSARKTKLNMLSVENDCGLAQGRPSPPNVRLVEPIYSKALDVSKAAEAKVK